MPEALRSEARIKSAFALIFSDIEPDPRENASSTMRIVSGELTGRSKPSREHRMRRLARRVIACWSSLAALTTSTRV